MPDAMIRGPWVDLVRQMGMRGLQDRYRVTGEALACVCLLHGQSWAQITFAVVPTFLGPVNRVQIRVACSPWCGYRLAWLDTRS